MGDHFEKVYLHLSNGEETLYEQVTSTTAYFSPIRGALAM